MADQQTTIPPIISSAFGSGSVPTISEAFGQEQQINSNDPLAAKNPSFVPSGPIADEFWKILHLPSTVLSAFGQGFENKWGAAGGPEISEQAKKDNTDLGQWLESKGHIFKAFNEGVMRPAVTGLIGLKEAGTYGLTALQSTVGGLEQAAATAGAQTGQPELGRESATALEWATQRGDIPLFHDPVVELQKAKAEGIIGPTEVPPEIKAKDIGQAPSAVQPTIHDIARSIDPDTLQQWDQLSAAHESNIAKVNALRDRSSDPVVQAAQTEIDTILGKVGGVEEKLTNKAAARLDDIRGGLEDYLAVDSPEMVEAKQDAEKSFQNKMDLAPTVRDIYRRADDQMPKDIAAEPKPASFSVQDYVSKAIEGQDLSSDDLVKFAQDNTDAIGQEMMRRLGPEDKTGQIAQDVSAKLQVAGRPAEEADVVGALVQAHYASRSDRMGGVLGDAKTLYDTDAPDVVSGKGRGRGSLKVATDDAKNVIKLTSKSDPSTFLHETGHQWLEELVKDSLRDDAPAELKGDVDLVKEWYNTNKSKGQPVWSEAIPRSAHEMWARGFERYLMEGKAPSTELASVFAKFKVWLTKIYNTVKSLNSPITDEIRQVFDRLLTTEPGQKPVIAPEEGGPPPEEQTFGPVNNESQTTSSPTASMEPVQTVSQKEGTDTGQPQESPRKPSKPVSEPDKASTNPKGASSSDSPFKEFGQGSYRFLDKEGIPDMSKVARDEDVLDCMEEIMHKNRDKLAPRNGHVTDTEIIERAESFGLDNSKKVITQLKRMTGANRGDLASRMYAAGVMVNKLTDDIRLAASDPDNVIGSTVAEKRFMATVNVFLNARAEWGLAGHMLNSLAKSAKSLEDQTEFLQTYAGKTIREAKALQQAVKEQETPAAVAKVVQDAQKPSFMDGVNEFARNAWLWGVLTHTTYALSNKVLAVYRTTLENSAIAGFNKVQRMFDETVPKIGFGEVREAAKSVVHNRVIDPDASKLAGETVYAATYGQMNGLRSLKFGLVRAQTELLPGENTLTDLAYKRLVGQGLKPGTEEFTAKLDKVKDTIAKRAALDELHGEGSKYSDLKKDQRVAVDAKAEEVKNSKDPLFGKENLFAHGKAIPGIAGEVIRASSARMVTGIHAMDRTVSYEWHIAQLNYRRVVNEGLQEGSYSFAQRLAEITKNPNVDDQFSARSEANDDALMGQPGEFTKVFQRVMAQRIPLLNWAPGQLLSPFVTVVSNLNRQALVDRGPFALLSKRVLTDLSGSNGHIAQANAGGKLLASAAFSATVVGLYMSKDIIGPPSSDWKEAGVRANTDGMPFSVRVGEMSYQMDRLGIVGLQFKMAAILAATGEQMGEENSLKAWTIFHTGLSEQFLNEGFLSGITDFLNANEDQTGSKAKQWATNFASGILPGVGPGQIAKLVDPYQRDANGFFEGLMAKTPFVSEYLEPKVDIWGNSVPAKEYWGVYASQVKNDPVWQSLTQAGYYPAPVRKEINGVPLTDQQHFQYATESGMLARQLVENLIRLPGWDKLDPATKHEYVSDAITTSRTTAAQSVMAKYPEIYRQSLKNRQALANGGPK